MRSVPCLVGLVILLMALDHVRSDDRVTGIRAPDGFEVELYAADELAHDIYSLTIDSQNRVVVAGRGYVRILIDSDGDGSADQARQFADTPANGAMGLCWDGRDLICTGDAGVLRFQDRDGDDRSDGPPQTLLKVKTGGEHDVHAIRKGPDGWWYLLGGNGAGLDERYATLRSSPVSKPAAGALVRLTPDFQAAEVIADGFRNPYDFAFTTDGSVLTCDSDGERDISLPWYRPTRVFCVVAGSSAGWVSRSWKRPGTFFDMPPVVASLGRGSPTGVEAYRHTQFPEKYHGGLFVLDWTYGRVMFVPGDSPSHRSEVAAEEFLTGVGAFGFAPTDAAVGADGSLFVSVGGRGTRGGVYRVRWQETSTRSLPDDPLQRCLQAPQPLSSWSRARWEPDAVRLQAAVFCDAALDHDLPDPQRVRALEILTEQFGGADTDTVQRLAGMPSAAVRARTAWMIGRTGSDELAVLIRMLEDDVPSVVAATLEALLTQDLAAGKERRALSRGLAVAAAVPDRSVRQLAGRVLARLDEEAYLGVCRQTAEEDWPAQITLGFAEALRQAPVSAGALRRAIDCLQQGPVEHQIEAVRLAQLALGDFGPGEHLPVFDGYACGRKREVDEALLQPLVATVLQQYPHPDAVLNHELGRLIALVQPAAPRLLRRVLDEVTVETSPVDDLHQLIIAARLPVQRTLQQSSRVARALLALDRKFADRGLPRDLNWDDRVGELFETLVERDPGLQERVIHDETFGAAGHVYFTGVTGDNVTGDKLRQEAVSAIVQRATTQTDYAWTSDLVRFLGQSDRDDVAALLRTQVEDFGLRPAVLSALARRPRAVDRPLFVDGLRSADPGLLLTIVKALRSLGPEESPREQVALVRTLRRIGEANAERELREIILQVLQANAGRDQIRQPDGTGVVEEWTAYGQRQFPEEWSQQSGTSQIDAAQLARQLQDVDWSVGDASRGAVLFQKRSCRQCHGGRRALGPDLAGVTRRFSRDDLFIAIALPNRDVSPRYQTTLIVTASGQAHTGIVIYESIDGLLLRDSQGQTIRIEADEIDFREQLSTSLMPGGLLKDLTPGDLADLYAFLAASGP